MTDSPTATGQGVLGRGVGNPAREALCAGVEQAGVAGGVADDTGRVLREHARDEVRQAVQHLGSGRIVASEKRYR